MSSTSNDEKLSILLSMGFDSVRSSHALKVSDGDTSRAIELILSGCVGNEVSDPAPSSPDLSRPSVGIRDKGPSTTPLTVVQTDVSQYSIENGRSACTCIALQGASIFLSEIENFFSPREFVTESLLGRFLRTGVDLYNSINRHGNALEHMSAEEVLISAPTTFNSITMKGEVRQGVVSSYPGSPLGFKEMLSSIRQSEGYSNEWMAVIITKTPETVCVCLPPITPSSRNDSYILIDSHPRPQFGTSGSFAIFHTSVDELVGSLKQIFPIMDLGNDVSEMMSAMYNTFDMYPLQKRRAD